MQPKRTGIATVAWGGDVNIGRRFHYRSKGTRAMSVLGQIAPLRAADLSIVNLECVVATGGQELVNKGERASYYFRARPEMLEALVHGGIGLVASANNHSGDYGPEALLEQAHWLAQAGIGHAGSGPNRAQAFKPVFRHAGALEVALFAIDSTQKSFAASQTGAGTAWLDPSKPDLWRQTMQPLIAEARLRADIVLVAVHWGANNAHHPDAAEIAAGHALIDAGADAVLGSSAHLLQGIEIYKDRPILHDAGDLLFDAMSRTDTDSGIFTLDLVKEGVAAVRFTPLELGFCRTATLTGEKAQAALHRFAQKCARLGTTLTLTEAGEGHITLTPPARASKAVTTVTLSHPRPLVAPLSQPKPEWLADSPPPDAMLPKPVRIGPVELLALQLRPAHLDRVGLLDVTSWWRLIEPTQTDWRIEFHAQPEASDHVGIWGLGSSHDPCDWMWPVSRWKQGEIYRDFTTLRPSKVSNWRDETLSLSVALVSAEGKTPRIPLDHHVRFALAPKTGFALLCANPAQYKVLPTEDLSPTPEILWTADQLQQVTGGTWIVPPPRGWYVGSVTHKSRQIDAWSLPQPKLLAAITRRMAMRHELSDFTQGAEWDTHEKLPDLQDKLAGAMVARPVAGLAPDFPLLQVDDPLEALIQLGAVGRNRLKGHVVAVTGSAGKTSQCLMLTQAMEQDRKVIGNSRLNYNSRVGILHLLANTPPSTDLVVVEAAVSAINAPKYQNIRLVRPDIGIITNITPSHITSGTDDLLTVAQRKSALIEGIDPKGLLLLNREIDHYALFQARAAKRGIEVMTFGTSEDADLRLESYDQAEGKVRARLPDGTRLDYRLSAPGLHMAMNSLAAIGVRLRLGGDMANFLRGLEAFQPAAGRGAILHVDYQGRPITVVDEAYNANPISMTSALQTFSGMVAKGRRVVILGDMAELGPRADIYHRDLADQILRLAPDKVLLCGPLMRGLCEELDKADAKPFTLAHFANVGALLQEVSHHLEAQDLILLKASNSVGLGRVVEVLTGSQAV